MFSLFPNKAPEAMRFLLLLLLLQGAICFVCPRRKTGPPLNRADGETCGGTCNAFGSCGDGLRCVPHCQLVPTIGSRPAGQCQLKNKANAVDCVDGAGVTSSQAVQWANAKQTHTSAIGRRVLFGAGCAVGLLALAAACMLRSRRAAHAGRQQRMTGLEAAQAYDAMDRAQLGNRFGGGGSTGATSAGAGFELPTREPQEWVDGV